MEFEVGLWATDEINIQIKPKDMISKGYMPNEITYTILVKGIIHEDHKELASVVLRELHQKEVISRNTVERLAMQYELEDMAVCWSFTKPMACGHRMRN